MRKLFWQTLISLDGFVEGPAGALDWFVTDEDFHRYVLRMLSSVDGLLMGRVTYQGFAGYWPTATDAEAPLMNSLPKVVFSRTLTRLEPAWAQSRLASRPVVDEIRALKASGGRDLALFGSATLAATVLAAGLIDEVRVIVNPVMLGGGQPMFRDPADRLGLELTSVERFRKGSVLLIYEPRRPAG